MGVSKDEAEALRLLCMAAGGGHARATYVLGVFALQGQGVARIPPRPRNSSVRPPTEAFPLYRQAADTAYPAALFGLGWLYETGNGVKKDEKEAVSYYRKAADLGELAAMTNLANMLQAGRGGPPNPDEAASLI